MARSSRVTTTAMPARLPPRFAVAAAAGSVVDTVVLVVVALSLPSGIVVVVVLVVTGQAPSPGLQSVAPRHALPFATAGVMIR